MESIEQVQSDTEANKQSGKTQHVRKRKKQYYKRIRQQMEFYFGDSNLSKDRYLNKLIAINPYVNLDVFMNFNKIKEMTHGNEDIQKALEDIQKALDGSEMLELSSDRQSVRRVTEMRKKDDIDEYMIYVEALPPTATHETVRQQFKQFGNVAYVSLPKFRNGSIKEFGFVEFEEKQSVTKCINAFRQFEGVIGDKQKPENLKSVVAYVKEQDELEKEDENQKSQTDSKDDGIEEKTTTVEPNTDVQKLAENDESSASNIEKNAIKTEANTEIEVEKEKDTEENVADDRLKKRTTKRGNAEPLNDSENPPAKRLKTQESEEHPDPDDPDEKASVTDENQDKKQEKRRRRKRNASHTVANNDDIKIVEDIKKADDSTIDLASLRVATKTEWKRLRNVYLTLQRKKYSEVKKLLQQNRPVDSPKVSTLPLSTVRPVTMKSKSLPPPAKRICTRNINFYGANRDEHNAHEYECSIIDEKKTDNDDAAKYGEKTNKKKLVKDVQFEFEHGLIVKVNFEEPCTDPADFKGEMRQYAIVKYIDVKEGQMHAFVRVDNPRSAPILIKHCAPNRCQILTGESEAEYWAKIAKDREQKLSKAVKVPRNRTRKMRNIIKNIAEVNVVKSESKTTVKHIRFDDD